MKMDKTYDLRLQPIEEITKEQMRNEVLAHAAGYYLRGFISFSTENGYQCNYELTRMLPNVTHFAVLPKEE